MYNEQYLAHHGVKGMKWGVRRYQNSDGSLTAKGKKRLRKDKSDSVLTAKQIDKDIKKNVRSGRLIQSGGPNVWGVRQKNGDILFVSTDNVRKYGVDVAEKMTLDMIESARAKAKKGETYVNKKLRQEEKVLVNDMIKTYDRSDPDYEEAMAILKEIADDLN